MLPEDEDSLVKYWVQVRYQPYCTVWGPPPMEEIQCNNSDPKVFFTFLSLFNWYFISGYVLSMALDKFFYGTCF